MATPQVPWFKSQWFWTLVLVLIGLRFAYKYWYKEQAPASATRTEQLSGRSAALKDQPRASQAASAVPVVFADSTVLADSAAAAR